MSTIIFEYKQDIDLTRRGDAMQHSMVRNAHTGAQRSCLSTRPYYIHVFLTASFSCEQDDAGNDSSTGQGHKVCKLYHCRIKWMLQIFDASHTVTVHDAVLCAVNIAVVVQFLFLVLSHKAHAQAG